MCNILIALTLCTYKKSTILFFPSVHTLELLIELFIEELLIDLFLSSRLDYTILVDIISSNKIEIIL